jgi:tripartite-type tricarboxylate transporter receptor subunit TctC
VVARKDFPAKNLKEFITYLKANGDKVKQAHGGVGSSSYLTCLQFTAAAGVTPTLVGYRGTGPALTDVIGGHIDFFCEQAVSVQGAIKGGTVKAYVVSGYRRLEAIPDVPSAKEVGLPGYNISVWSGIFAPKGTPKPVVATLINALNKTLDDPATVISAAPCRPSLTAASSRWPSGLRTTSPSGTLC